MSALLFEPITINGVEFRNRIAMSPMCMHSASDDGHINDFHVVHYGSRALGGAGLIMLAPAHGSTPITQTHGVDAKARWLRGRLLKRFYLGSPSTLLSSSRSSSTAVLRPRLSSH